MTVETFSEALFKQHCTARGVEWSRLDEGTSAVADFELSLPTGVVVAEIKQIDPNEQDLVREAAMQGGGVGSGHAPTKRLRNLLGSAYRQIKPYAFRGIPAAVVCYNNAGGLNHIDNFTVTSAMFGGMATYIALGQDGSIHQTGQGFTGNRKLTRNTCRGISAVCVLSTPSKGATKLVAYHNPFASNPLLPSGLRQLADAQVGYNDPHAGRNVSLLAYELEV